MAILDKKCLESITLHFYLRQVKKNYKKSPKIKKIKIKVRINVTEKDKNGKINETKSQYFVKINKTEQSLAGLIKQKRRHRLPIAAIKMTSLWSLQILREL